MGMKEALLSAVTKGYHVREGQVYGPTQRPLKLVVKKGYPNFKVRIGPKSYCVPVHRYVAFTLWGDKVFDPTLVVRHLDGDRSNFSVANLAMGTHQDNSLDVKPSVRKARMVHASKERRLNPVTITTMQNLRNAGNSCAHIAKELGISRSSVYKHTKSQESVEADARNAEAAAWYQEYHWDD